MTALGGGFNRSAQGGSDCATNSAADSHNGAYGASRAAIGKNALYDVPGHTNGSKIKDRNYFQSLYVHFSGGILTACAASMPGGNQPAA